MVIDKHTWAVEKVRIGGFPPRQPGEEYAAGEGTPVRIGKSHSKEKKGRRPEKGGEFVIEFHLY